MIKKIIKKLSLSGFAKKEDGNTFIIMAFIAPLLVIAVGVGVDTAEIYRAKVNFQNAVDAGAIVVAKIVAAEGSGAETKAKAAGTNVFNANMGNLDATKASIQFHIDPSGCAAGSISATATLNHRVFFDAWHGLSKSTDLPDHAKLTAEAEVQCGNTTLEMAMVLDNSGSMGWTPGRTGVGENKITTLRNAATDMVSTLHDSFGKLTGVSEPLRISVVPFASMVNVGNTNANAVWMDTEGRSSIHNENLNWALDPNAVPNATGDGFEDASGVALTRFRLYTNLGYTWRGCVESRPYPLLTQDVEPSATNPDTLIVPSFAPDTPTGWRTRGRPEEWYWNDYLDDAHNFPASMPGQPWSAQYTGAAGGRQYGRMSWTWKYFQNAAGVGPQIFVTEEDGAGPNVACTSVPLSELSANQEVTEDALDSMVALGATNIQQGAIWGWRTLSSGEPFTQGRNNSGGNRKVMILMTDGENTYYPTRFWDHQTVSERTRSTYGSYGFAVSRRIFMGADGDSGLTDTAANYNVAMNEHLAETCVNVRADGIEIYTIAFDVAAGSTTRALLESCASLSPSGQPLYFEADNSAELTATFKEIAERLSDLKLIR